jgi:hypothetical protein
MSPEMISKQPAVLSVRKINVGGPHKYGTEAECSPSLLLMGGTIKKIVILGGKTAFFIPAN